MQSDVPPLPISCLTTKLRLNRIKDNSKTSLTAPAKKNNSLSKIIDTTVLHKTYNSKSVLTSSKRKLRPVIAGSSPYINSARLNVQDTAKTSDKSVINQRVSSAKMLRIKQLQNQLADAHFHLNELSNENKLLKAIQKRQDTALKRYEGTNAELPRIINTHHEDLRVLQTKYKKLKSQYNHISDRLKEKENELQTLQAQNKKLLQLSRDRNLGEREKLQTQVFDLTHRMNEQDETIQTLKRKLTLETKYLKHQLHVEMVKHKETQKQLQETQYKLKNLEELHEQRAKRSYQASRISAYNKARSTITSQSLTNLSDHRSEYSIKSNFRKFRSEASTGHSLPTLNGSNNMQESIQRLNSDMSSTTAETFRLENSPILPKAVPFNASRGSVRDSPIEESRLEEEEEEEEEAKVENEKKSPVGDLEDSKILFELPKSLLLKEEDCVSEEAQDKDKSSNGKTKESLNYSNRSRLLHARLVNSASEGIRSEKAKVASRSRSLSKENLDDIAENDKEMKYDRDSVITVISRDMLKEDNYSNSDLESEMEIPMEFSAEEEDKTVRKSDINIDEAEMEKQPNTSSHLSALFNNNQQYKPSSLSFDSNDNEATTKDNEKTQLKSLNGLMFQSRIVAENVETSLDDLLSRKKAIANSKSSWLESSNDENLDVDDEDDNVADEAEKLLEDIDDDLRFSKNSNVQVKNKSNYNAQDKSDVKSKIEQNTASENSKAFDKAKLLAAMKAIDDNENIEFVEQKRKNSGSNRLKITENLYRGVPTHSRKKSDIMKELFPDTKLDNNKN